MVAVRLRILRARQAPPPAQNFRRSHRPLCVFVSIGFVFSPNYPYPAALPNQTGLPSESAPQSSASGIDFESAVLMRMRQAERERLEREIREQEASET